jgi:hypothetical protein
VVRAAEPRDVSAAGARASRAWPKCPAFKSKDSVLQRPNDEPAGNSTVCPGQHTFAKADTRVVWWDPGALELDKKPTFGVRREDLIVKDVQKERHCRWAQPVRPLAIWPATTRAPQEWFRR